MFKKWKFLKVLRENGEELLPGTKYSWIKYVLRTQGFWSAVNVNIFPHKNGFKAVKRRFGNEK